MLPLLRYISDNKEYKMRDVTDGLAEQLGVTEDERKELLPSGAAPGFYNGTESTNCFPSQTQPFRDTNVERHRQLVLKIG